MAMEQTEMISPMLPFKTGKKKKKNLQGRSRAATSTICSVPSSATPGSETREPFSGVTNAHSCLSSQNISFSTSHVDRKIKEKSVRPPQRDQSAKSPEGDTKHCFHRLHLGPNSEASHQPELQLPGAMSAAFYIRSDSCRAPHSQ